jgi:hypothetical protein
VAPVAVTPAIANESDNEVVEAVRRQLRQRWRGIDLRLLELA